MYNAVKRTVRLAIKAGLLETGKVYNLISIMELIDSDARQYFEDPETLKECERAFYKDVRNSKYNPIIFSSKGGNYRFYYRIKF